MSWRLGWVVLALGWNGDLPTAGFLPVFWGFVAACLTGLLVSLATQVQEEHALRRAFGG
jgi:hypothetical protein